MLWVILTGFVQSSFDRNASGTQGETRALGGQPALPGRSRHHLSSLVLEHGDSLRKLTPRRRTAPKQTVSDTVSAEWLRE